MKSTRFLAVGALALLGALALVAAQAPTAQDHVAALKKNLGESAALLKQYEWIETTVINLKGEEKARTEMKDAKDVIGLKAGFGLLNDGAMYPAEITLSAPSQSMEFKITNSGYKKM